MVLTAEGAVLLLIDLQERLMPVIADHETVVARAVRLAEAASLLDVPVRATEQHPKGLGSTVPPLAGYPQAVMAKTAFSAACRHTLQVRNSESPSFHSFVFLSRNRGVDATRNRATGWPAGVKRSSGSSTRLPAIVIWVSPAAIGYSAQ